MPYRFTMRRSLPAAILAAGLAVSALPAQAMDLRHGFVPGLIGGLALGALAASAHAAHQQRMLEGFGPMDFETLPEWEEQPVEVLRSVPAERRRVRRAPATSVASPFRAAPSAVESCRDSLVSNSRRFGAVTVRVADAGPQMRARDGAVEIPLTARIAYAHKGQTQIRRARVTCALDRSGRVLAFR